MWSESSSLQRQKGVSSGSNINDQVLSDIAEKRFGGDKSAAASWQSQNPFSYQKDVEAFLERRQSSFKSNSVTSQKNVKDHYSQVENRVGEMPQSNPDLQKIRSVHEIKNQEQIIDEKLTSHQTRADKNIKNNDAMIADKNIGLSEIMKKSQKFEEEKNKYLISKAANKALK